MRFQKGIALIQVLIMASVISLYITFMITTTKDNLDQSFMAQEIFEAKLKIKSLESEVLFVLLTGQQEKLNVNGKSYDLNFYGQPIFIEDVEIALQDHRGKLHGHFYEQDDMIKFFQYLGFDRSDAVSSVAKLADWQDRDDSISPGGAESINYGGGQYSIRNGSVIDLTEIKRFIPFSDASFEIFEQNVSLYRVGGFDANYASNELIKALYGNESVRMIADRNKGIAVGSVNDVLTDYQGDLNVLFNNPNKRVVDVYLKKVLENGYYIENKKTYIVNRLYKDEQSPVDFVELR